MSKLEGKLLHDMMKVVFVAAEGKFTYMDQQFNGQALKDMPAEGNDKIFGLATIFGQMGPLDFNAACWRAQDEGYLFIDKETGKIDVLKVPEEWGFDSTIEHLITVIPYVLGKLAETEVDPEENFLGNYVASYLATDVVIALRYLQLKNKVATYEVKDVSEGENGEKITDTYVFYTLSENKAHRWGENQFKDHEKLEKE